MNSQIKLSIATILIVVSGCCSTNESSTKYSHVEPAVLVVVEAMRGEFGNGEIRGTFTADSLKALLLKQERQNEYDLLLPYKLELSACKNHYRLRVYDGSCLIMDDVNCTKGYLDARVYAGEKPLPENYDLCNCGGVK